MAPDNVAQLSTAGPHSSIGAILVDEGKLSIEDADRILRLQKERSIRFGDAAVELKLLTNADIEFALSRQFNYPYLDRATSKVDPEVVAAFDPKSRAVEAMRTIRSQLMLRWFDPDRTRKTLIVASPQAGDGRSFTAANLAVLFAQLGERTLLVDADMRRPSQHRLFGLQNPTGLSEALAGRGGTIGIQAIPDLPHLYLLPSGATPPNSLELLSRPSLGQLLDGLRQRFDIILFDTPAAEQCADAQALAARAGGALIVARKNASRLKSLRQLADDLSQAHTTVVGAVLNDF